MINKKKLIIILLPAAAFVAAVGAWFSLGREDDAVQLITPKEDSVSISPASTTMPNLTMKGDGKVELVSIKPAKLPPAPSLDRPTDFKNTLSPQVKTAVFAHMQDAIEALKKDGTSYENWVLLGGYRKNIGDYTGARDAWGYAGILLPNEVTPWNNLGDLYHFYIKDYVKSEENWKKTITLKPDYIQGYRGLYELYTYSYKEKSSEIPVILKQGIEKNPTSTELKTLLANYEASLKK